MKFKDYMWHVKQLAGDVIGYAELAKNYEDIGRATADESKYPIAEQWLANARAQAVTLIERIDEAADLHDHIDKVKVAE